VYVVPEQQVPNKLFVKFSLWQIGFDSSLIKEHFQNMSFQDKGLTQADFEETVEKATKLLQPYRGKIARIERYKNLVLVLMLVLFFIISILVGLKSGNWLWTAFVITIYIAIAAIAIYSVKFIYSRALRQSHMLLSLFCRVENNRLYLKLGLELRPGYLAKWIELQVIDSELNPDLVGYFKARFLKPSIEYRSKQTEKELFKNTDLVREQKKIELQILSKKATNKKQVNEMEQREVAEAALESNPNDFSSSDLGGVGVSSVLHSQSDMMLNSAVKLSG
jgi:hypothetical protein